MFECPTYWVKRKTLSSLQKWKRVIMSLVNCNTCKSFLAFNPFSFSFLFSFSIFFLFPILFRILLFEVAAMPFPCNGILVVLGNLTRILPVSSLIYASFLIPSFNIKFVFIGEVVSIDLFCSHFFIFVQWNKCILTHLETCMCEIWRNKVLEL